MPRRYSRRLALARRPPSPPPLNTADLGRAIFSSEEDYDDYFINRLFQQGTDREDFLSIIGAFSISKGIIDRVIKNKYPNVVIQEIHLYLPISNKLLYFVNQILTDLQVSENLDDFCDIYDYDEPIDRFLLDLDDVIREMRRTGIQIEIHLDYFTQVLDNIIGYIKTQFIRLKSNLDGVDLTKPDWFNDTDYLNRFIQIITKKCLVFGINSRVLDMSFKLTPMDLFYSELIVINNNGRSHINGHSTGFIRIGNNAVEYFDTGNINAYNSLIKLALRRLYDDDMLRIIFVNNSDINLQGIAREYEDLLCQGWTLLYIYCRLVRRMTLGQFRRTYINSLALQNTPTGQAYYQGFIRDVLVFTLNTIKLIAPERPRSWTVDDDLEYIRNAPHNHQDRILYFLNNRMTFLNRVLDPQFVNEDFERDEIYNRYMRLTLNRAFYGGKSRK